MKNKTHDHTTIDEAGNILTDCCICIGGLSFDEIDLHTLVRDSLRIELFSKSEGPINPAYVIELLEQHFCDDAFKSDQTFAFLKSIVSSCAVGKQQSCKAIKISD